MGQQLKLYRVFIASPGDLGEERKVLREVVEKINSIYSKETDWRIELLGWEDTLPGAGRPQELINADLDKADLFIGCLWQRWGSSSGLAGKTGFEEEFDRAIENRSKSNLPEIWLFFKEVEPVRRSDPGEQLQKVLAFRQREIEAKRVLFNEFRDTPAWREAMSDMLQRQMLRLVTNQTSADREARSASSSKVATETPQSSDSSPKTQPKSPLATASLADLLKEAESKIRTGKLSVFDKDSRLQPASTARLFLFSATNYDQNAQRITFGTHETNSVYYHRNTLELTSHEKQFLFKTILMDESLTKPGWFWVKKWKVKPEIWLPWFALHDAQTEMRKVAIKLAQDTGFALFKKSRTFGTPIVGLLSDGEPSIRLAALEYLTDLGRPADLASIEKLLKDDDKDVRAQAERTLRSIRLRTDVENEVGASIARGDSFDEELATVVGRHAEKLSNETLKKALSHPSEALRSIAAKEFIKRGNVEPSVAVALTADSAKSVKEQGFLAQIENGDQLNPSSVRASLSEYFYSSNVPTWNKADAEKVVKAIFGRMTEEELWKRVAAFDDESHFALQVIGNLHFEANSARIRTEVADDFQSLQLSAQKQRPQSTAGTSLLGLLGSQTNFESVRKRLRVAGLKILAKHANKKDRDLFVKFLSSEVGDYEQSIACLKGLATIGYAEDRGKVAPFLSNDMQFVQAAAARAYLALSPNLISAVKDLLAKPNEYQLWVIIEQGIKAKNESFWPILKPLLKHETDNIRRFACYYASRVLSKSALKKLLDEYLKEGYYYYNVVTLLDRSLYAPDLVSVKYSQDEQKFFENWKPSATWYWHD